MIGETFLIDSIKVCPKHLCSQMPKMHDLRKVLQHHLIGFITFTIFLSTIQSNFSTQ